MAGYIAVKTRPDEKSTRTVRKAGEARERRARIAGNDEKVCWAGGTKRPAANIARNTVIAANISARNSQQPTSAPGNLLTPSDSKGLRERYRLLSRSLSLFLRLSHPLFRPPPYLSQLPGNSHLPLYVSWRCENSRRKFSLGRDTPLASERENVKTTFKILRTRILVRETMNV